MNKYLSNSNPHKSLGRSQLLQNLNDITALLTLASESRVFEERKGWLNEPVDTYKKYCTAPNNGDYTGKNCPFKDPDNKENIQMWKDLCKAVKKFNSVNTEELKNSKTLTAMRDFFQYILDRPTQALPVFYASDDRHPYFNIRGLLKDIVNNQFDDNLAHEEFNNFSEQFIDCFERTHKHEEEDE